MNRIEELDAIISQFNLNNHPFYQDWRMGTLPLDKLRSYGVEYARFIGTIDEGWDRIGETKYAEEERYHEKLWAQFQLDIACGEAEKRPQTETLVTAAKNAFALEPEAVGALYSFEAQQPYTSQSKLDGPRVLFVDRHNGQPVRYGKPSVQGSRVGFLAKGIGKAISIDGNRLRVEYKLDGAATPMETQINLAMPSCDGFLGRYLVDGKVPGGLGESFIWEGIKTLTLEDGVLRGRVVLTCSAPATIHAAPHKTVSQSEDGFEKIMQAVTLKVSIPPQASEAFLLTLTVEPLPD